MPTRIGPLHLRRSLLIKATPERVWQEFTSFEKLSAWFGRGHVLVTFEPKVGGHIELYIEPEGKKRSFGGPVLVFEEGRELTFEDHWLPQADDAIASFITIRLTPLYDGTLVELFHHGIERWGNDAADALEGLEAGWTVHHLQALRRVVEG